MKRCYELAGKFLLKYPQCDVIHGIADDVPHAWVEFADVVYDGTCKGFFELAGYYAATRAQPVRRFTGAEFAAWMATRDTWGPCDELERAQ